MAQHSPKWPACPECRHNGATDPCAICLDADCYEGSAPGESGEAVDYAAWADDSLAACAEARRPRPSAMSHPAPMAPHNRTMAEVMADEGVSRQEIDLANAVGHAACTDGIPRPEVIREPVPAWPPAKIRREG